MIILPFFESAKFFDLLNGRKLSGILLLEGPGCFCLRVGLHKGYASDAADGIDGHVHNFPGIGHSKNLLLFYLQE